MKTIQQVLGFVQGWQCAIRCDKEKIDDNNEVYQTLLTIEQYIKED